MMGQRRNAYVSLQVPAYGGKSPNTYVGSITVEVRAFWPPYLDHEPQVIQLIADAASQAVEKIREGN